MLAVSGIDHTIKIFSPDRRAQRDARLGINLGTSANHSAGRSSLRWPGIRRRPRSTEDNGENGSSSSREHSRTNDSETESLLDENTAERRNGGLSSRRRLHEEYQIVSQNDVERQGGMRDAFMTVSRNFLSVVASRWSTSVSWTTLASISELYELGWILIPASLLFYDFES